MLPIAAAILVTQQRRLAAERARQEELKRQAAAEQQKQAAALAAAAAAANAASKPRVEPTRYDRTQKVEKVEISGKHAGELKTPGELQAYKLAADEVRKAAKAGGERLTAGEARQVVDEKLGAWVAAAGKAMDNGATLEQVLKPLAQAAAKLWSSGAVGAQGVGPEELGKQLDAKPKRIEPANYTVKPGDTLSGITESRLKAAGGLEGKSDKEKSALLDKEWKRLYEANKKVIGSDPDLIVPGQKLKLPEIELPKPKVDPETAPMSKEDAQAKEKTLAGMDKVIGQLATKGDLSEKESRQLSWLTFKRSELAQADSVERGPDGVAPKLSPEAKALDKALEPLMNKGDLTEKESRQLDWMMFKRQELSPTNPVEVKQTPAVTGMDKEIERVLNKTDLSERESRQLTWLMFKRQELGAAGGVEPKLSAEAKGMEKEIEQLANKGDPNEREIYKFQFMIFKRMDVGSDPVAREPSPEARAIDAKAEPILAKGKLTETEAATLQSLLAQRAMVVHAP